MHFNNNVIEMVCFKKKYWGFVFHTENIENVFASLMQRLDQNETRYQNIWCSAPIGKQKYFANITQNVTKN